MELNWIELKLKIHHNLLEKWNITNWMRFFFVWRYIDPSVPTPETLKFLADLLKKNNVVVNKIDEYINLNYLHIIALK